jgi:hypothetical protein
MSAIINSLNLARLGLINQFPELQLDEGGEWLCLTLLRTVAIVDQACPDDELRSLAYEKLAATHPSVSWEDQNSLRFIIARLHAIARRHNLDPTPIVWFSRWLFSNTTLPVEQIGKIVDLLCNLHLATIVIHPKSEAMPVGDRRWQCAGKLTGDKMQPQVWQLAKYLFERLGQPVSFANLIDDGVFSDDRIDDETVAKNGRKVTSWFNSQGIALRVESSVSRREMTMLECVAIIPDQKSPRLVRDR